MIKWRRIAYAVVVVIIFLALTVIAAVNYSGDEADSRARQNGVYRYLNNIVESSQEFFISWPIKLQENKNDEEELVKEGWDNRIMEYVQISRSKEGLIIIMKNSQGEFFNRIWPIFSKKEHK